MGYRSEVALAIHPDKVSEFLAVLSGCQEAYDLCRYDDGMKTDMFEKVDLFVAMNGIKWYEGYKGVDTIDEFITTFMNQEEESLFGVIPTKDYYWDSTGKLVTPWPKNQTIMNTKAVDVTFKAAHTLYASRLDIISNNMFMGDFSIPGGIKLYPMDELECFDIDYEWQFKVAKSILENGEIDL